MIIDTKVSAKYIDFDNSLSGFISDTSKLLTPSAIAEKFASTIEKLKGRAILLDRLDISEEKQIERVLIIKSIESLLEIDKLFLELTKTGANNFYLCLP